MVDDLIKRQYAIDAIENITWYHQNANKDMICGANSEEHQAWYKVEDVYKALNCIPSAQPERILYANMSDAEFEKWLYEHGICHPNIHESIPCDVVPLLIDNAISELPSAQPEIIRCNDCKHWTQTIGNMRGFGLGDCDYINAKLVNCNGFCYWAERREE